MGDLDVRDAVDRVVMLLRDAGRHELTIREYQAVLDRFAAFLTGGHVLEGHDGLDQRLHATRRGIDRHRRELAEFLTPRCRSWSGARVTRHPPRPLTRSPAGSPSK